ncbi:MAG: PilN domain-containing protein [Candidatus Eremiobacteraeota bacterium]|nr:PilN domain-containing protein [Candidatus Eremiobacteraeota bacterium]
MTSFDYLGDGGASPRGLLRFFSTHVADGTLAMFFACAMIPAAAWALEAEHLHRALDREAALTRAVERGRIESAQSARRDRRARSMNALIASLDAASASGVKEARRLTELANALPQNTWLTALSHNDAEYSLEGGAAGLAELGRALGAAGGLANVRQAVLVEAAPAAQTGAPEALRYRMRLLWKSP